MYLTLMRTPIYYDAVWISRRYPNDNYKHAQNKET